MTFPSTMWTLIGRAKSGSHEAMGRLLARYRPPILQYLRGRGLSEHDAEDVAQEVFLEVARDEFLQGADRAKGRFRTLLLRVTQHVSASSFRKRYSAKRGGDRTALSLAELEDLPASEDGDRFNELWVRHLIRLAMERLRRETAHLRVPYSDVLRMRYLEGRSNGEIAESLRCRSRDVEIYLYHGKQRLKKCLLDLTREYSSSPEEHAEETALIRRHVS